MGQRWGGSRRTTEERWKRRGMEMTMIEKMVRAMSAMSMMSTFALAPSSGGGGCKGGIPGKENQNQENLTRPVPEPPVDAFATCIVIADPPGSAEDSLTGDDVCEGRCVQAGEPPEISDGCTIPEALAKSTFGVTTLPGWPATWPARDCFVAYMQAGFCTEESTEAGVYVDWAFAQSQGVCTGLGKPEAFQSPGCFKSQ